MHNGDNASWGAKVQDIYPDRFQVVANFKPSLRSDNRQLVVRDDTAPVTRCWGNEVVKALLEPIFSTGDDLVVIEPDLGQGDVVRYLIGKLSSAKGPSPLIYCGGMVTFPNRKSCIDKIISGFAEGTLRSGLNHTLANSLRHQMI